jgi:6-phosphofructokinase 1
MRIGVLTSGGDCPGLNAVIRAVTKCAILQHGLEVWGIEDGFLGLIEDRVHPLPLAAVANVLTLGGTILGASNKSNPQRFNVERRPGHPPVYQDVSDTVLETIRRRGLDALLCIGGDGTLTVAAKLAERGVPIVGAPKTIDNDVPETDVTFGFHTAVEIATDALDRIHTTAASHHRVMLVELMGRYSGWLALYAGAASGADIILIPEIPYDLPAVCAVCATRSQEGKRFTLIAVAEGARPVGGKYTVNRVIHDSPDPTRLGGVSEVLCEQIAEHTHLDSRATILGHVQRGGTPCAYDRVLATIFGRHAVDLAVQGRFGRVVVQKAGQLTDVPLSAVADRSRHVPLDDPVLTACRSIGVSFGEPPGRHGDSPAAS